MTAAGLKLVESLVLRPDVRVRAYRLNHAATWKEELKNILLDTRLLPVNHYVIMTQRHVMKHILDQVRVQNAIHDGGRSFDRFC